MFLLLTIKNVGDVVWMMEAKLEDVNKIPQV